MKLLIRVALAQRLQMPRRRADRLDHDGDGACLAVEIGDGERDPLPLFVDHQDDELSRLAGCGDRGSLDDLHVDVGRIIHSLKYLVHVSFLQSGSSYLRGFDLESSSQSSLASVWLADATTA